MPVVNKLHRRRLRQDRRLGGVRFRTVQDLYQGTRRIEYEGRCGQHVQDAIAEVVGIARRSRCPGVWFMWNGHSRVTVLRTDTVAAAVDRFEAAWERIRREYAASPAARRRAEHDRRRTIRNQRAFDAAIASRPVDMTDLDAVVEWIARWQPHIRRSTKWSAPELLKELQRAGYVQGAHTCERDAPEAAELRARLEGNRKFMGEYLVGQAMSCMASGMPPHDLYQQRVKEWRVMPA